MAKTGKIVGGIVAGALVLGAMGTMLHYATRGGKTAYDIACEKGFAGTQEEWLASLQGSNGTNGSDGLDGRDGLNGRAGQNGLNGLDGLNGRNGKDGIDGLQGPTGEKGVQGEDGVIPHIDEETGNWFIGEENTGVQAQGPIGNLPHLERRSSSFSEIYEEILEDYKYDASLFKVAYSQNPYNVYEFKNINTAKEYYENLGGTHITFDFDIQGDSHRDSDDGVIDKHVNSGLVGDYKFVNIEHDGINDIAASIVFSMAQETDSGLIQFNFDMTFDYIDGKYCLISECETLIDGVKQTQDEGVALTGYRIFADRNEYINVVAPIAYASSYAVTSNIIDELIIKEDFKERSFDFKLGELESYIFSSLLPFSEIYTDGETYTFNLKFNPAVDSLLDIGIDLEKTENKQATSLSYSEHYKSDEEYCDLDFYRKGTIEKETDLTFEHLEKISDTMSEIFSNVHEEMDFQNFVIRFYPVCLLYENLSNEFSSFASYD